MTKSVVVAWTPLGSTWSRRGWPTRPITGENGPAGFYRIFRAVRRKSFVRSAEGAPLTFSTIAMTTKPIGRPDR